MATDSTRRSRRLATVQSDIKSALEEVSFLQTAATAAEYADAIAWASSRLDYARETLKGLKRGLLLMTDIFARNKPKSLKDEAHHVEVSLCAESAHGGEVIIDGMPLKLMQDVEIGSSADDGVTYITVSFLANINMKKET